MFETISKEKQLTGRKKLSAIIATKL